MPPVLRWSELGLTSVHTGKSQTLVSLYIYTHACTHYCVLSMIESREIPGRLWDFLGRFIRRLTGTIFTKKCMYVELTDDSMYISKEGKPLDNLLEPGVLSSSADKQPGLYSNVCSNPEISNTTPVELVVVTDDINKVEVRHIVTNIVGVSDAAVRNSSLVGENTTTLFLNTETTCLHQVCNGRTQHQVTQCHSAATRPAWAEAMVP